MTAIFITLLPALAFVAYLLSFVAHYLDDSPAGSMRSVPARLGLAFLLAAALLSWLHVRRLPVYGTFETCLHLALVLALCLQSIRHRPDMVRIRPRGYLLVAGVLGLALSQAGRFNPDFYMYQALQVQLFFGLRLTAGGILLFASLVYACAWAAPAHTPNNGRIWLRTGKNSLILATILFLASELSGTIWCMQGWGDTWRWSRNFFESAGMFLLLMLPLHAPQWLRTHRFRALTGTVCTGLVVLGIALP